MQQYASANDLNVLMESRKHKSYATFQHVLDACYKKVFKVASVHGQEVIYEVPEFVLGMPPFNLNECIAYVHKNLVDNGYVVKYIFPKFLHIAWKPSEPRNASDLAQYSERLLQDSYHELEQRRVHEATSTNSLFLNQLNALRLTQSAAATDAPPQPILQQQQALQQTAQRPPTTWSRSAGILPHPIMHDFHEQFLTPFENTAIATRNVYGTIKASTEVAHGRNVETSPETKVEPDTSNPKTSKTSSIGTRKRNGPEHQRVAKSMTLKPTGRFVLDLA